MSFFETPEQRQIRQLRSSINTLTSSVNKQKEQEALLRRQLELLERQRNTENQRMEANLQRRIQEAVAKERSAMSASLQALDRQVQEKERLQNEKLRRMQAQHTEDMRRMDQNMQAERQGLQQEIRQTRAQMQANMDQLRVETDTKLRQQRTETQQAIADMGSRLEGQITAVDQRVSSLAQQILEKENGKRELAEYWSQEAERMLRQLMETFRPQLFDAKQLAHLQQRVRQSHDDIRTGLYEAAVTSGREAFYDALDMKETLTAAELEWNFWFNALRSREAQLLQDLDSAQRRVYSLTLDGETVEDDNGIDYWTNGQLSVAARRIEAQRQQLETIESLDIQELRRHEEAFRGLQEELALIENAAHINVAMSLSRFETASKIGEILDADFRMIDSDGDFFSEENRDEYHAIFQNPNTGDQVAVVITPMPDEAGIVTNHIELIVGNADNHPLTRERIAQAVAEKLRQSGVENCAFPCARRYGDSTAQEVARVGNIAAVACGDEKARASRPVTAAPTVEDVSRVSRGIRG